METSLAKPDNAATAIESVLIQGDLSKLSAEQRVVYYNKYCESVGLNPLTTPLKYMTLNGKLVLYAGKEATDQLRKLHSISIHIVSREKIGDVYVVTARAKNKDGREDESTGAVAIGKASGDILANLFMKSETKAKRRVTLSICGLGLLDESEVETIPNAVVVNPTKVPSSGADLHGSDNTKIATFSNTVPNAGSDFNIGLYVIPFGPFKGKTLSQVEPWDLTKYRDEVIAEGEKSGKKREDFSPSGKAFLAAVDEYLKYFSGV